jgi:hypothetical protein
MMIQAGTTDVTRYVMLVDPNDGTPETGLDVTALDLQYIRNENPTKVAAVAKQDVTALTAITDAHADNKMYEVDGTSSPGLYRVDWPDAAFASGDGVTEVLLTVSGGDIAPAVEEVQLIGPDPTSLYWGADTALTAINLDHLMKTAVASGADLTTEVADGTVLSHLLTNDGDTSDYDDGTMSLEALSDSPTMRLLSGTSTNSSTDSKVYVQAGDPPSGGSDDDYNNCLIIVWRGADKSTARVNVSAVSDYDDSDPSFTLSTSLGFTPVSGDLVEVWAADTETLAALDKLTNGFGTAFPDTLEGYLRCMMNKAAGDTPTNCGTYDPATDSLEHIGESLDLMAGSGFSTSTDSLKAIRDAIDTLLAPSVVGSSALSGSGFLSDCVTLIRRMTDEPSLVPKYTDSDLVEHLTSAMTMVMSELHNNSDHNIICRFDIQLVSGQQTYILPPNVGEVWAVRKMGTTTPIFPIYEVWADNHWSSHQSGFVIEGNEFRLLTDWRSTDILEILYVPNGESHMHLGTPQAAAARTITLDATPTDGTLDTRANAYAGYLCRLLTSDEGYVQERIIDSYDNTTQIATLTTDWDPTPTGTMTYEVLPSYSNIIKHCACMQASLDILGNEGNAKRTQLLERRYLTKIRALRQMITKKSSRFGGHGIGDTSDNDNRGDYYGWLV